MAEYMRKRNSGRIALAGMAAAFFLAALTGCGNRAGRIEAAKDGGAVDRTRFEHHFLGNYFLSLPEGYSGGAEGESYPLVVYLHGSGGSGDLSSLDYLGYARDPLNPEAPAASFRISHPCFVLAPQTRGEWKADALIRLIESTRKKFRIDPRRVYLIGFSMGGSASFALANEYFDRKGAAFAGIIRMAGQSQTELRPGLAGKTAVWIHQGLADAELRVSTSRAAFESLKALLPGATLEKRSYSVGGYEAVAECLSLGGRELLRKTEYPGLGHGIFRILFDDPGLIEWLFAQSLPAEALLPR
jgi:predicted peptidase